MAGTYDDKQIRATAKASRRLAKEHRRHPLPPIGDPMPHEELRRRARAALAEPAPTGGFLARLKRRLWPKVTHAHRTD